MTIKPDDFCDWENLLAWEELMGKYEQGEDEEDLAPYLKETDKDGQ